MTIRTGERGYNWASTKVLRHLRKQARSVLANLLQKGPQDV